MSSDKQFEPSSKKLKKAKEEGKIAKSPEVGAFLGITYCILLIISTNWWGHYIFNFYHKVIAENDGFSIYLLKSNFQSGLLLVFVILAVWGVGAMLVSTIGQLLQVGFRFSFKQLEIKFSFLNITKGIARILKGHENGKFFVGMFTEILQLILFASISTYLIWKQLKHYILISLTLDGSNKNLLIILIRECIINCIIQLAIVAFCYMVFRYSQSKRRLKKELMMDVEELKKEFKEDEGDPHTKGQRKSMHQEIIAHEMIENVKNAKVLIVSD